MAMTGCMQRRAQQVDPPASTTKSDPKKNGTGDKTSGKDTGGGTGGGTGTGSATGGAGATPGNDVVNPGAAGGSGSGTAGSGGDKGSGVAGDVPPATISSSGDKPPELGSDPGTGATPVDAVLVDLADCAGETDQFGCEVEIRVLNGTNKFRGEQGLDSLKRHKKMARVAAMWSEQLNTDGVLSHNGFPDARNEAYAAEFGAVDATIIAENVAFMTGGSSAEDFANQMVDGWVHSPGHRANMLSTDVTHLGVGMFAGETDNYITQIFGVE